MINNSRRSGLMSAAVLCAALFSGAVQAQDAKPPIKVGFVAPLTGPVAVVGDLAAKGLYPAIDLINRTGGLLGRQLQVISRDDQGDPNKSLAAVKDLVTREKIDVMMSGTASSAALATSDFLNDSKVITMAYATNIKMFNPTTINPFNFAVSQTSDLDGASLGEIALSLGVKRFALAKENLAFGSGIIDGVADYLKTKGVTPVTVVEFPADGADLTSYVLRLKNESPDLIVACTQAQAFTRFFQAMKRLNVTTKVLGCYGIATPQTLELASENMPDGTMSSVIKNPPWRTDIPNVQAFIENFRAKWNALPKSTSEAGMYNAVVIWAEAVRRAGTTDSMKVKEALESMKGYDKTANTPAGYSQTDHRLYHASDFIPVYLVTSDKIKGGGSHGNRSWIDAEALKHAGIPVPDKSR